MFAYKIELKIILLSILILFLCTGVLLPSIAKYAAIGVAAFIAIAILIEARSLDLRSLCKIDIRIIYITTPLFGLGVVALATLDIAGGLYIIFSVAALLAGYNYKPIKSRNSIIVIGIPIILLISSFTYTLVIKIDSFDITSNYVGAILFTSAILWHSISGKQIKGDFFWIFVLLLVMPTFTRSIILGVLISYILFYFAIKSGRSLLLTAFIAILAIFFYQSLIDDFEALYQALNIIAFTGKNLETGRIEMWQAILHSMSVQDYLLGGFDLVKVAELSTGDGRILSAHNGYLSILASNGILGVFMAALIPISFLMLGKSVGDYTYSVLFVYVFSFLVREVFEVTLHGNNFPIAGTFWLGVGLLLREIITSKKNQLSARSR